MNYNISGVKKSISASKSTAVIDKYTSKGESEIFVEQTGNNGFYIEASASMYTGEYTAMLVWVLESGPIE